MTGRTNDRVRYRIGPLTTYADAGELRRWWLRAKPGDEKVYAIGPALGRDAEVPRLARELDGGRGGLFRKGSAYIIRKSGPAASEAPPAPATFTPDSPEGRVLAVLEHAAAAGRVCPSNADLAELAGLDGPRAAEYRIGKLIEAGLITRAECPAARGAARSVTIVATGETTPCPASAGTGGSDRR